MNENRKNIWSDPDDGGWGLAPSIMRTTTMLAA